LVKYTLQEKSTPSENASASSFKTPKTNSSTSPSKKMSFGPKNLGLSEEEIEKNTLEALEAVNAAS
jgi:energy-coupling factor transporter ATP-binding protein EcfA2